MKAIHFEISTLLLLCFFSTISVAATPVMPPPTAPDFDAFDRAIEKRQADRNRVYRELMQLGDMAASSGIAYGEDEWRSMAREIGGIRVRLSDSFLEQLRQIQNKKAAAVADKLQR